MTFNYELSATQKMALSRIGEIGREMLTTWDREYLFDLYCEAEDIWNENFPFEASQVGDDWYLTKRFNDLDRKLREEHEVIQVQLFGCTININGKEVK